MFKDKRILITGATGSWGYELTKQLLTFEPKEIRLFSRNELAQVNMKRHFQNNEKLTFVIGDVRDYQAVYTACAGVDYVFHLAALKHVPICEAQPLEALKTNVTGTENIIRAGIACSVKKVVDVSSDKAVDPTNFYGMTKAIGEKLIIHANETSENTRFVCIRGGNVLGTNGSIVPLFKNLIQEGKDLPITSTKMTRFFLTVKEAIGLLLTAAAASIGGETFVMNMPACRIVDLAEVLIESLCDESNGKSVGFFDIGVRPGEKIDEILISKHEALRTYQYDENYYVILPTHASQALRDQYRHFPKVSFTEYESNTNLMNKGKIKKLLILGGFLP